MNLRDTLAVLSELPWDEWIFIPEPTTNITLDLPCHFVDTDDYLNDEIERYQSRNSLKSFFYCQNLDDIQANLRQQKREFCEAELEAAIDHYWRHDGFYVVP